MTHKTLQRLADSRSRLLDVVATMDEADLERPARHDGEEGWTIRQVLTHLLNAEEDHCKVAVVISRGQHDRLPTEFSIDEHNQQRMETRGTLSRDEIVAALAAQRERTVALFGKMDAPALEMSGRHPALGEMTVGNIFRIIGMHEKMHLRDIEAALNADGASAH